jgi:hypothetical protein
MIQMRPIAMDFVRSGILSPALIPGLRHSVTVGRSVVPPVTSEKP